jgi:hypothetical protein
LLLTQFALTAWALAPSVACAQLAGTEEATLAEMSATSAQLMGVAVALTSDGTRAFVGASHGNVTGANGGRAYVFVRSGTSWAIEASLVPVGLHVDDAFGFSIATTSDGSRVIVGAPGDDRAGADGGAAHVFVRGAGGWSEEAVLVPTGTGPSDYVGVVGISDDGTRALVGAPGDDVAGAIDQGSAHVFVRVGSAWSEEASLLAADGAPADGLGRAVALSGDGMYAVVGAPLDDTGAGTDAGSARVFVRAGTSWMEQATLSATDGTAGAWFGRAVASTPDGSRVLVGEPQFGPASTGRAHVYARTGVSWSEERALSAYDASANDAFGSAVSFSRDAAFALVGAEGDDGARGSARLFAWSAGAWPEVATLVAPDRATLDSFGGAVALDTSAVRALVGARFDDRGASIDAGSARVLVVGPARPVGGACTMDAQCATHYCTDSVCCAERCAGGATDCQACAAVLTGGADGSCAPLAAAVAPTVVCRPSASPCDAAELCVAGSSSCPPDAFASPGTVCRPALDSCDVADTCTGSAPTCPADVWMPAGAVCRPPAGGCDLAEVCSGSSARCPPDAVVGAGARCAGAGACSAPGTCDGRSARCFASLLPAGTVCRARDPLLLCDVDDVCDGSTDVCLVRFAPRGTPCRLASAACDVTDSCSGANGECIDTVATGTVCRPAIGSCDTAEICDGTSRDCPADVSACFDADLADASVPADGAEDLDAGRDAWTSEDAQTASDAAALDGSTRPDAASARDAGELDASVGSSHGASCACSLAGGSSVDASWLALGALVGLLRLVAWRARARRRDRPVSVCRP